MPLGYPKSSYVSQVAAAFARTASGEPLNLGINLHYRGSLIPANQIKEAVAEGRVLIGERLLSAEAASNPLYSYDSIPFLAAGLADNARLARLARPALREALADEGLELLYSVPFLPQGIYANRRIDRLADLRGLRLRVYSANSERMAELLGMEPVHVENANLLAAIAEGRVDAVLTSAVSGVSLKLWNHYRYFHAINAWMPRAYAFANRQRFWRRLRRAERASLAAAGRAAEEHGLVIARLSEDAMLKTLTDNGIEVREPDQAFKDELRAATAVMRDEWLDSTGATGAAILRAFDRGG